MESRSLNIVNANIISLDDNCPNPKSLIINNGIIESVEKINSSIKTIDCCGATIVPGFIDSHFHLKNLGKRLDMVQLKGVDSLKKIQDLVINECKNKEAGDLILGFGWDQNLWESKDFPLADILNISPKLNLELSPVTSHPDFTEQDF